MTPVSLASILIPERMGSEGRVGIVRAVHETASAKTSC